MREQNGHMQFPVNRSLVEKFTWLQGGAILERYDNKPNSDDIVDTTLYKGEGKAAGF